MDRIRELKKKHCQAWKENKLVNPLTGKPIQEGKSIYNKIKERCEYLEQKQSKSSPPVQTSMHKKRTSSRLQTRREISETINHQKPEMKYTKYEQFDEKMEENRLTSRTLKVDVFDESFVNSSFEEFSKKESEESEKELSRNLNRLPFHLQNKILESVYIEKNRPNKEKLKNHTFELFKIMNNISPSVSHLENNGKQTKYIVDNTHIFSVTMDTYKLNIELQFRDPNTNLIYFVFSQVPYNNNRYTTFELVFPYDFGYFYKIKHESALRKQYVMRDILDENFLQSTYPETIFKVIATFFNSLKQLNNPAARRLFDAKTLFFGYHSDEFNEDKEKKIKFYKKMQTNMKHLRFYYDLYHVDINTAIHTAIKNKKDTYNTGFQPMSDKLALSQGYKVKPKPVRVNYKKNKNLKELL